MNILKTILQLLLVAVFAFFGTMKIIGAADMVAAFESFGYSDLFMRFTGGVEVVAAISLLIGLWKRPFTLAGGALIIGLTVGAIYSHIFRQNLPSEAIPPFVVMLVTLAVLFLHQRIVGRAEVVN